MAMKRGDRVVSLPHHPNYDWEEADRAKRSEAVLDTSNALYAVPRAVRRRVVSEGHQSYVAYDAHRLLEEGDGGRPGHLYD